MDYLLSVRFRSIGPETLFLWLNCSDMIANDTRFDLTASYARLGSTKAISNWLFMLWLVMQSRQRQRTYVKQPMERVWLVHVCARVILRSAETWVTCNSCSGSRLISLSMKMWTNILKSLIHIKKHGKSLPLGQRRWFAYSKYRVR